MKDKEHYPKGLSMSRFKIKQDVDKDNIDIIVLPDQLINGKSKYTRKRFFRGKNRNQNQQMLRY